MIDFINKGIEYISVFLALMVVFTLYSFVKSFIALKCGDPTPKLSGRLTLNPIVHIDVMGLIFMVLFHFGWIKPLPLNINNFKKPKRDFFIYLILGILTLYFISFIFFPLYCLSSFIPEFGYFTTVLQTTLFYVNYLSLVYIVFNIIPFYPFEGFNFVELFDKKHGGFYRFSIKYGIYVFYGLIFLSIIADITGIYYLDILGNVISFFVGIFEIPIYSFWFMIFGV